MYIDKEISSAKNKIDIVDSKVVSNNLKERKRKEREIELKSSINKLEEDNFRTSTDVQPFKQKQSFHLYVDCTPIKQSQYLETIEISDFLKPVLRKIQQEKNLSHYRLAGYGQHVGLMAHYLEEHIKENDLDENTAILSSSKTPEGIDTLQTLSAAASIVVRGF